MEKGIRILNSPHQKIAHWDEPWSKRSFLDPHLHHEQWDRIEWPNVEKKNECSFKNDSLQDEWVQFPKW